MSKLNCQIAIHLYVLFCIRVKDRCLRILGIRQARAQKCAHPSAPSLAIRQPAIVRYHARRQLALSPAERPFLPYGDRTRSATFSNGCFDHRFWSPALPRLADTTNSFPEASEQIADVIAEIDADMNPPNRDECRS